MADKCFGFLQDLAKAVDQTNNDLVNNMTDLDTEYKNICVQNDLTCGFYRDILEERWSTINDEFAKNSPKCGSKLVMASQVYQGTTPEQRKQIGIISNNVANSANNIDINKTQKLLQNLQKTKMLTQTGGLDVNDITDPLNIQDLKVSNLSVSAVKPEELEEVALDIAVLSATSPSYDGFKFSDDGLETGIELAKVISEYCSCDPYKTFAFFASKYQPKYGKKFKGKSKEVAKQMMKNDFEDFKYLTQMVVEKYKDDLNNKAGLQKANMVDYIASKITTMYRFSIESELDKLIPEELGSMKKFFVKIISTYYNELHPIVWAQIYKKSIEEVFIDLPITQDEWFQFGSKQLLLNSGPYILKILQMIRPVISDELADKYNLKKLQYPLLTKDQIEIVLNKVMIDKKMWNIIRNISASVGHVSIVERAENPKDRAIVKIIKPLSIAQSCWEYKTLAEIFPPGCERDFVINMLESNGRELNVLNEIENIKKAEKYYKADYKDIFGKEYDNGSKLRVIEVVDGIIKPGTWYAMAMSVAPGVPISSMVETKLIETDTKFRARLHRCLDLLVCKFYEVIFLHGFYHGDLHAGNIFFSFRENQLTLIDLGAVGELDFFDSKDPAVSALIEIIIMSTFHNFDNIFDKMTDLLNSKCEDPATNIDKDAEGYKTLKKELYQDKINNFKYSDSEKKRAKQYIDDVFNEKRFKEESVELVDMSIEEKQEIERLESIYSPLSIKPITSEDGADIHVENQNVLPDFTEIKGKSKNVSFNTVLEKILKYYATTGVNVAVKFSDFYEFQKAYALLLGVLHSAHYSGYRASHAMSKFMKLNWKNFKKVATGLGIVVPSASIYRREKSEHKQFKKQLREQGILTDKTVQKGGSTDLLTKLISNGFFN